MSVLELLLIIFGLLFFAILITSGYWVIFCYQNKQCTNPIFNNLSFEIVITAISGILLAITLVYQVIQFRVSRFQTIFHHQIELHNRLVNNMVYKNSKGGKALFQIDKKITKKIVCQNKNAIINLSNVYIIFDKLMLKYDYMLTPYFRHITSVLTFLKYRSPNTESKYYPDYYLNIFSKSELRLFFFYSVCESYRIAMRNNINSGNETNFAQLFTDINFYRYFNVAFNKKNNFSHIFNEFIKHEFIY